MNELKRNACKRLNEQIKTDFITRIKSHSVPPAQTHRDPRCDPPCRASPSSLSPPLPRPEGALTCRSQWQVSPMKGKPMDPLGMGSLQFLSRVAVHLSCQSCWETARSRAMDTRQAARVARAETRSKLSNSMVDGEPGDLWVTLKKKVCRSGSSG